MGAVLLSGWHWWVVLQGGPDLRSSDALLIHLFRSGGLTEDRLH